MEAKEEVDVSCLHMVYSFLALESPDVVLSFAREFGDGSITQSVQSCIWHRCISKADLKWNGHFLKKFLKKLILEVESTGDLVLDELYEFYASRVIPLKVDDERVGNSRVLKTLSYLFPCESSGITKCPRPLKLEVQLRCSVNMLEGDTGCSIWPSSIFLSEFVLSFPEIFTNKCCFEIGSGVGSVGICLSHVKASKVILTDGDLSTLANMKVNLELNHLSTETSTLSNVLSDETVQCVHMPWESASKEDLRIYAPDIILGADIIYDPSCLAHLVKVLSALLKCKRSPAEFSSGSQEGKETSNGSRASDDHLIPPSVEGPVAFIASVIRNVDTFNYFLEVAEQANLVITDLTEKIKVFNFLPYLKSYDRSTVRMLRIHVKVF